MSCVNNVFFCLFFFNVIFAGSTVHQMGYKRYGWANIDARIVASTMIRWSLMRTHPELEKQKTCGFRVGAFERGGYVRFHRPP